MFTLMIILSFWEYDVELFLGSIVLSIPTIVNWITFAMWEDKK